MAAGNGFGTSPMGFNKNEVNEYIANLSKRMSEIETEKKELEKKYESVKKIAEGADEKVRLVETEAKEKIDQLENRIKTERKNSEELIDQVDELKRKLKNAGSAAGSRAGGSGNTADAEKRSAAIIAAAEKSAKDTVAAANKTAEEIVEKAKRTAAEIASSSGGARGSVDLSGFMAQVRAFADSVNAGCKAICDKAAEISDGESGTAVEMPDFTAFASPAANVPDMDTKTEPDMDFGGNSEPASDGGMDEINALLASMTGENTDSADDNMDGGFGFSSASEPEKESASKEQTDSAFGLSFDNDMFAGLSDDENSSGKADDMGGELTADFGDAVEASDVKLNDTGFDLNPGNEMDEMQKLLEQAELTFGGGSSEFEEKTADAAEETADDWSSLQSELDALEKQGGIAENVDMSADSGESASDENPDNDIWSLGNMDMSENDDDDMSSDLFGSF